MECNELDNRHCTYALYATPFLTLYNALYGNMGKRVSYKSALHKYVTEEVDAG